MKVHEAIADVMADVRAVGKDGKNQAQGYQFRGIDGVLNAVGPALRRHKVVVVPQLVNLDSHSVEVGKARNVMRAVTVTVRYSIHGPEGDHLEVVVPGEAFDAGDKAVTKAMSVALRTALIQVLCLPTNEPDPDESSYERSPAPVAAPEGFDPEDMRSWPEQMTVGQAKNVLVAKRGKDVAAAVWASEMAGHRGNVSADRVMDLLEASL